MVPEILSLTDRFFCHFGQFFAHLLPKNSKIKILKKWKKTPGDIIILQNCTKNQDHVLYCSWDMAHNGCNYCNFSFWTIFCPFTPSNSPRNEKIFLKIKKTPGDVIILHKCTKNHDHMIKCSWNMVHDGCNYFSFWAIFCSFTPLTTSKMKIKKKLKKYLEISFYTLYEFGATQWFELETPWLGIHCLNH